MTTTTSESSPAQAARMTALDAAQRAIVVDTDPTPHLVLGAPGTGKSTVLIERAAHDVERGLSADSILLLAPSRKAADRLRDQLTDRLQRTVATSPARSWQSYAFDLLRRARASGYLNLPAPPRLLSGAEQDQIISDLLAGHRRGEGTALVWPPELHLALPTRGFRQEIRQLFDRVTEYGLDAETLAELGRATGRQDWESAAVLYAEYRDVLDLRMPEAFDPAGIITEARRTLQENPQLLADERERLRLILVDDLQEATPAIHELLHVLVGDGPGAAPNALLAASPESVTQGFRGARPDLLARLGDHLKGLRTSVLGASWRLRPEAAKAWGRVAERISVTGEAGRAREFATRPDTMNESDDVAPAVEVHVVASAVHEDRFVAERLLRAHLYDGVAFERMAVIVRTGARLASLARSLQHQGVPVALPAAEKALRDEVAVEPLLKMFALSLGEEELTPTTAIALLTSRFGGASPLLLRRLRQRLRVTELEDGGGRASEDLLVEALRIPGVLAGIGREAGPARTIANMLAAGTAASDAPGASPETVLWALWEASGMERRWTREALDGGPAGARADRDLDALMALFQMAERYVDQLPGASPAQFLDYVTNQELPMDTLAERAPNAQSVQLLTPASAAGRQWDVVVIAGLQEGVWPNQRLRGELLGSSELADVLDLGIEGASARDPLSRLREVRDDELRSFSVALSRASEAVICVGVDSAEEQPSSFLDVVGPWPDPLTTRPLTPVPRPSTLRALIAELRQFAQSDDPLTRAAAIAPLARLAALREPSSGESIAPGADPEQWWGVLPLSTEAPIVDAGDTVVVSPSKVQTALETPLNWFISAAGGERPVDFARSLGTLVHQIAETLPEGTPVQLREELDRRWPQLRLPEGWLSERDRVKAEGMISHFAQYLTVCRTEGRTLVAVEKDFDVELSPVDGAAGQGPVNARLRGQVDRLEVDDQGRLFVADLKTGMHLPTKQELDRMPQLGAYQVAVVEGGFAEAGTQSAGAAVVGLASNMNVSVRAQEPIQDGEGWALEQVRDAATTMTGASFLARHEPGEHNRRCLATVCPLCSAGRQVTE